MKKSISLVLIGLLLAGGAVVYTKWGSLTGSAVNAKAGPRARVVSVELARAEKQTVPIQVDALGTVTPIASVALKSRVESTIIEVHFGDGAKVREGDLLFTLDARQIEAQILQAEGNLARAKAQLAGAERDLKRFSDLIGKGATTQVSLDNAQTQADVLAGTIKSEEAALANLKVQKSYTIIRAPVTGRISAANVKAGNFVRPADTAPLATINQMAPVYVTFSVPQRVLADLRDGMSANTASVRATIPESNRSESGKIAMVENTVDATTGMVIVRGVMDNANEILWPGTLVQSQLTIRTEEAVVVPTVAVQRSQTGDYVFVIRDGKAVMQPVVVARTSGGISVLASGLAGSEDVVVDGQLLLVDGTRVEVREKKAGA